MLLNQAPALPYALDWLKWVQYWWDYIPNDEPWVRFLKAATAKAIQMTLTVSRELRQDPIWERRGWTPEEWVAIDEVGKQARAWFEQNVPSRNLPPEFKRLERGLHGCFLIIEKICDELRQAQLKGYITVNVSAQPPDDLALGEEHG